MERLNLRMCEALARNGKVALVGPRGSSAFAPSIESVDEVPHRPLSRFLAETLWIGWRRANAFAPTRVLAGSGLVAPHARFIARRAGVSYAVYVHGLDLVAPHQIYQRLWLPAIRAADRVIANSSNTARLALSRGVDAARLRVVTPGTDFVEAGLESDPLERANLGLAAGPVLLSVGRLTARKGLARFVREVLPRIVDVRPDVQLVIVGSDAIDAAAVARESERARIVVEAQQAGVANNVQLRGVVDDRILDALYRHADIHVFPVRDLPGDVEGFGMVALEAAAHGVPTLGYAVGGVPDAMEQERTGKLVKPDDAGALAEAILSWLGRPRRFAFDACRAFASANGWDNFERRLMEALE